MFSPYNQEEDEDICPSQSNCEKKKKRNLEWKQEEIYHQQQIT
jgi:hypothetical protein